MGFLRQLVRGLQALANRTAADQDVADEVEHYLEQATKAHLARGLSPEAARRAASIELGGVTQVTEQVRSYGWENVLGDALADLRYGWRRLIAAPGFTSVVVLTLALGLGGTTAILGAVSPILFEPLPYPDAHRIVSVLEVPANGARVDGTFGMYREFQERARAFEALAVFKPWQPAATGGGQAERVEGQRVSAGFFKVLGVSPVVGRDFDAADDRPLGPNVVIISDALWRRRFAADANIVGRPIRLDDDLYTVIGVMPRGFENVLAPSVSLWALLQYDTTLPAAGKEWGHHLGTVGRLRSGVRTEDATRDVNVLGRGVLTARRPETYDPNTSFHVAALQDELTRGVELALLTLLASASLVLVIASVNVVNLLLARGVQRRAEFALRAALGAGRTRLVRQLVTESLLLAAIGGAVGLVVAKGGVRVLVALSPSDLPRVDAIGSSGTLFAYGLVLTTLIGLVFGLIPAFQALRADPQIHLRDGPRHTVSGNRRTRAALVVAEVALALVLLVTSGLLLRSMAHLIAVRPGFDAKGLVAMQIQVVGHRFDTSGVAHRFFAEVLDAVRRVPGVTGAGFTSQLPLSGERDEYGAQFDASPTRRAEAFGVFRYAVSPGYVESMRTPLQRGRVLEERDGDGAPLVALISESLARTRFRDEDPIGQRLRIGPAGPYTVVGVVGDLKQVSLALTESGAVYTTSAQWPFDERVMWLVVRASGDAATLPPALRQAVRSVDKDQPIVQLTTMDELLAASAAERRFALVLVEVFALMALVLAAAGIYGVVSGSVVERTREIGVRMALGASPGSILGLVARQGGRLGAIGIALGLAGAYGATQLIASQLFGVSRLDPVTYASVVLVLVAVTAVACAGPAWRAARLDPTTTLRAE